jgi:uncharacterized membrane protein YbhN (UPF0104 family)
MGVAVGELATTVLNYAGILLIAGLAIGLIALRWLRLDDLPARLRPYGERLLELGKALYARPGVTLGSFMLALLVQFGFVGLNYFLATAMDIRVSLAVWLVAWPLAKIMALLPVSLGGLGVREAALAALLAPFAVTATLAIAQALVWQSVLLGFGVLAGMTTLMGGQRPAIRGAS